MDIRFTKEVVGALMVNAVDLLELLTKNVFEKDVGLLALPFGQVFDGVDVPIPQVDEYLERGDLGEVFLIHSKP